MDKVLIILFKDGKIRIVCKGTYKKLEGGICMAEYKRVLLKLSGEALAGDKKTGFDEDVCRVVAKQVKKLIEKN
jgi:hypothetical protein